MQLSNQSRIQLATGNEKNIVKNEIQKSINAAKIDEGMVKNLVQILEIFFKDRVALRVIPFRDDSSIRVVGPLIRTCLRDSLDDIRFKFGSHPEADWTVFGQIAAVPVLESSRKLPDLAFASDFEAAIQAMFASLNFIEAFSQVAYPEIAITPIAIYRE